MSPEDLAELTRLADQRRAEVDAEYGQYVAAQDITFNGVLAYPKGSPVPVSNVKDHGYLTHGLVESAEQAQARRDAAVKASAEAEVERRAQVDADWQRAVAGQENQGGEHAAEADVPGVEATDETSNEHHDDPAGDGLDASK